MKFLKLINIWSWPIGVIREIKEWNIVRKACKEEEVQKILKESNLRVDDISRMYTVINVPEELAMNQNLYWPVIMEKLKPLNEAMLKIGISELIYPEIKRVNKVSFLIILGPEIEYLTFKQFFYQLLKCFGWYIVLGTVNNILLKTLGIDYLGEVGTFINSLFDYLPI